MYGCRCFRVTGNDGRSRNARVLFFLVGVVLPPDFGDGLDDDDDEAAAMGGKGWGDNVSDKIEEAVGT
jgi:hypothetical protein